MMSMINLLKIRSIAVHAALWSMIMFTMVACGNSEEAKQGAEQGGGMAAAESVQVEVDGGDSSAGVAFKDEDGNVVSLSSLKGKVVFINFWATWCPPCIYEMPSINDLKKSFSDRDDMVFLMVDVDNKIDQSVAFMRDNQYDLPVYVPASMIPSDFLAGAIPTTVILDKEGEMVARLEGGRDYTDPDLVQALNELVADN